MEETEPANPLTEMSDSKLFSRDPTTWASDMEALEEVRKRIVAATEKHRSVRASKSDPFNFG